jgi:hypothetical protein
VAAPLDSGHPRLKKAGSKKMKNLVLERLERIFETEWSR